MTALPQVSTLQSLSTLERATVLDILFEPSTQLHTLSVTTLQEQTFSTYEDLVDSVASQLASLRQSRLESDHQWLDRILAAHPRLGEKKVESALSRGEQGGLQSATSDLDEEISQLRQLNHEFEGVYGGLKYVVFVNGRGRPEIMEDMRKRIKQGQAGERSIDDERDAAIKVGSQQGLGVFKYLVANTSSFAKAMALIAKDRANKLVTKEPT